MVQCAAALDAAAAAHRERAAKAAAALRAALEPRDQIEGSQFRLDEAPMSGLASKVTASMEFVAVTTFTAKLDSIADLDAKVTRVAGDGLVEVERLEFAVRDENGPLTTARRLAIADARNRAAIYADAAGVALADIAEITDNEPQPNDDRAAMLTAVKGFQIIPPATLTFRAAVTVAWHIKPLP